MDSVLEEFLLPSFEIHQHKSFPLHLTGSVAWIFQDEIKNNREKLDVQIGNIAQSPGVSWSAFTNEKPDEINKTFVC